MSGARETMVSPSPSTTRRKTPCVDGCCGPMLRTIVESEMGSEPCGLWCDVDSATTSSTPGMSISSAERKPARLVPVVSRTPVVCVIGVLRATGFSRSSAIAMLAVSLHRVVLAERVAVPVVGHHDAGEARMAGEAHAEEVEDFALVEVGGRPDGGDAVDVRDVAVDAGDDADALLQTHAEDRVRDLEARLGGVPVDGGHIFEEVVAVGLRSLRGGDDRLRRDGQGEFLAVPLGVGDEVLQRADGDVVG